MQTTHGGNIFTTELNEDAGPPIAEYQSDTVIRMPDSTYRQVAYEIKLTRGHRGPDILVFMVNPHDESDGYGGRDYVWDALLWADDRSRFDVDWLLDTYSDALHDELRDCARNWTS